MKHRLIWLTALGVLVIGTQSFAANAILSGVITSDEAGSPAIGGAVIKTYGEPSYSATSGSNGAYTLTAPQSVTGSTYENSLLPDSVLVTAPGHISQRWSVMLPAGAITRNFELRLASSGSPINLPAPLDWGEPPSAPTPPGDSYPISFTDTSFVPAASAPKIAECNDILKPDESFTMTGAKFTARTGSDAGTDTIVWVWARTSDSGGVLKHAKVWRVTENTITALMPADIPYGMYLVWVENENGVSAPVCVNRTRITWVGPLGNAVGAGAKKRVFGRNLSYQHGTTTSYVYIQPAAGGAMTLCALTSKVDPYTVEFTVPVGTPNGNYKVFVHNGWGGVYGWSDGLDLVVETPWARGITEIQLTPSLGGDDTAAIQNAINTQTLLPNGGIVKLSAGNFILKGAITVSQGVELKGAGMYSTNVLLQLTSAPANAIGLSGQHPALSDLTVRDCAGFAIPGKEVCGDPGYDIKYSNFKLIADAGQETSWWFNPGWRSEMTGCEMYRCVYPYGDSWIHNSTLYGDHYETGGAEAGVWIAGWRVVFEDSHVETKDWPVNNGDKNYFRWINWNDLRYKVWAKRVVLTQPFYGGVGISYTYVGNITAKDVAVDDNKGEMLLYHGMASRWFGQAASASGLTLNLRTDGLVDGVAMNSYNYGTPINAGTALVESGFLFIDGAFAIIIEGKGKGQARRVVSHTTTSVNVDKPWTTLPDSTSRVVIGHLNVENVFYNHDLSAFPVGYDNSTYSASSGFNIDGNAWKTVAENITTRRTWSGGNILSQHCSPSYWNMGINLKSYDIGAGGFRIWQAANPAGPMSVGNAFRSSEVQVTGPCSYGGLMANSGEGSIFENVKMSSSLIGYQLSGVAGTANPGEADPGPWQDGFALTRNGSVTMTGPEQYPVNITVTDGKQYLVNNTYTGASQIYYLGTGLSSYSIPVAMYKQVRFTGNVGYPVQSQLVPIANGGIAAMAWSVAPSDPWITASIQANSTLLAESPLGRLVIGVDTIGMTAGRHWGSVTINTGSQSVKVGVCVDLNPGTPASSAPVAAYTVTPTLATTPMYASFNAAPSYDTDGLIVSYTWDFGDGTYGSGVNTGHVYAMPGTYAPVLTVTDNSGMSASKWSNITAVPALSGLTLSGNPVGAVPAGAMITLTANAIDGYQPQYKFLAKTGSGWNTIRDYASSNAFAWTPTIAGYYEVKAYARNSNSTNAYDVASNVLSYPVGLLPANMKLWLKADVGVTVNSGGVSSWGDQSGVGNTVSQDNALARPSYVENAVNGRPVVRFVGPDQILLTANTVLSGATAFTAFTVGKMSQITASSRQYFWWNGSGITTGGYGCMLHLSGNLRSSWGSGSGALTDSATALTDTWYRIVSRFNGSTHEMWVNGVSSGTTSKTNSNLAGSFAVGNYSPSPGSGFYGDIAEIIIYDGTLSDTDKSNVESYLSARWSPAVPVTKNRLFEVKALNEGVAVSIQSPKVVTVASGVFSDGSIYIEEPDRSTGLKVLGAPGIGLWNNVTLTGTVVVDSNGEKLLQVSSVDSHAIGTELGTLGMSNKSLVSSGQLVRVWGKVTAKTDSSITVDDGSGAPVRAQKDGLVTPLTKVVNIGDYVSFTGPAGLMAGGVPCVRPRSDTDIRVY